MEAEEYYCNDNNVCAQLCYDKAIAATKMHRFINDEALAYERAAIFYFETNKTRESLEHFKLAYEKYHTWGALGKCNDISKTINEKTLIRPWRRVRPFHLVIFFAAFTKAMKASVAVLILAKEG
jgi:tetratricopeptide (TPR) repeat protein